VKYAPFKTKTITTKARRTQRYLCVLRAFVVSLFALLRKSIIQTTMNAQSRATVTFTAPRQVEICQEQIPDLKTGQALVQTICSAISPGSEMLVYNGQFPQELADAHDELSSSLRYPLAYGYACVGRVLETGPETDETWRGELVFAFQPHTSHFVAPTESLLPVPEGILPETACFLPNMETAVNLVQDAAPILGERALVLGQGIVGLLATALLGQFPLHSLVTLDSYALRCEASLQSGATASLPSDAAPENILTALGGPADLALELSGNPAALNQAIALTGFSGRIVIGSWYGKKRAALELGGSFHRSRIKLISSQVSTISPELSARWDKSRRFEVAWDALRRIRPAAWITQRFNIKQASEAYQWLQEKTAHTIQPIFTYGD
jgi:2-desacetyl-2-hydroxyethyl bacteriochlorophyllide A dehydrogenase